MKRLISILAGVVATVFFATVGFAQLGKSDDIRNFRFNDQRGINIFETPKQEVNSFDGLKVIFGGASTLQFQGLSHSNNALFLDDGQGNDLNSLIPLEKNFNLATANMDIDVLLEKGVRMHLRAYLSSRHHPEPYVKGGYLQVDRLDFVKEGFLDDVMNVVTFKVGHMENNYGDAHFRRSDNAMTFHNPFGGNYIMDGFTTEVGGEIYLRKSGLIGMFGLTNGKLNQDVISAGQSGVAFLGKLGFDKQLNSDLRMRLTASIYSTGKAKRIYLYSGDRSGSRYYSVMRSEMATSDNFRSGRWNPNFADKLTAIMVNPFVKWQGFEFFGTYENASGGDFRGADETRTWEQMAGELIYRFGADEKLYTGFRLNSANGKLANADENEVKINRLQAAFGWFLTKNVGLKFEYLRQTYHDFPESSIYSDGKFNGVVIEAMIAL